MAGKETHRSFNIVFKLLAVEEAERSNKSFAAKKFNVDVMRVREWCKMKDSLIKKKRVGQSSKKRLDGGGRKAAHEDLEELLFDWVTDLRTRNLRVSRKMIMNKAKIAAADTQPDFKASRGWLQLFMKRKGLSLP